MLNPGSMPARAAQGSSAGAILATNTGDVQGSSNFQSGTTVSQATGIAGGGTEQAPPPVPEVFLAQKGGKAKVEEGGTAETKAKDTKKFCFRCCKPGHGKLEWKG
jgi:hypothetical protein